LGRKRAWVGEISERRETGTALGIALALPARVGGTSE